MTQPTIIKSPAPNNKQIYMVAGVLLILIGVTGQSFWPDLKLQFGLLCLAALSVFVIGVIKHLEPAVSLIFDHKKLQYFHRYGQWTVQWSNVSRVHIPVFSYALEHREISYIGLKVNDLEALVDQFSPRLASRIIHEHRDILALAVSQGDATRAQVQINFDPFKFPSGYQVAGPMAACLHQMQMFEKVYGAHLFIPFSGFSQPPQDIVNQMNALRNKPS